MTTNQDAFNQAAPSSVPDELRAIEFGDVLRSQLVQVRRNLNPVAQAGNAPYGIAATEAFVLPNSGKACKIERATSKAGTTTGEFVIDGYTQTAPAAGHIGISPNGDLMFAPSADTTAIDVTYVAERGDVVEVIFPVASNALALPTSALANGGVVLLLEAESLEGTLVGKLHVLLPTNSNPATGKAVLNVAKTSVLFATADAVTRARVKLLIPAGADLNEILDADAQFL